MPRTFKPQSSSNPVSVEASLLGTHFQFRAAWYPDLEVLIAAVPPWLGDEAFHYRAHGRRALPDRTGTQRW